MVPGHVREGEGAYAWMFSGLSSPRSSARTWAPSRAAGKVVAVRDQLGAESPHRDILVGAVPLRHHYGYAEAPGSAGEGQVLAVITPGC